MATATKTKTRVPISGHRTIADLLDSLGGIAAERVRFQPLPGTATERDVLDVHDRENRLCELVDGTLVEKVMGFDESIFAILLSASLIDYLKTHDLGKIVGADGMMRLFPGLVRIPDSVFISWKRYPRSKRRRAEIPAVVPDLVVEVLSKSNTPREMARKLERLASSFQAGRVHRRRGSPSPRETVWGVDGFIEGCVGSRKELCRQVERVLPLAS